MKHRYIIIFILFCFLLALSGCTENIDETILCNDFYELNKNRSFEELSDLSVVTRGSKYDPGINQYQFLFYVISIYDSIKPGYVSLPIFNSGFDQERRVFALEQCDYDCINILKRKYKIENEHDLLIALEDYSNKIQWAYKGILLPNYSVYASVLESTGEPYFGIISFKLTDKAVVYHVLNKAIFKKKIFTTSIYKIR